MTNEIMMHKIVSSPSLHDLGVMRLAVPHEVDRAQFTYTDQTTGKVAPCVISSVISIRPVEGVDNIHLVIGRGLVDDIDRSFMATLLTDDTEGRIISGNIQFI